MQADLHRIVRALCSHLERRQQAERTRAYVEEHLLGGQPLTDDELAAARGEIAAIKARAVARRDAESGRADNLAILDRFVDRTDGVRLSGDETVRELESARGARGAARRTGSG